MNLLIFAGLADNKLISKLTPISALDKVETIYLVRNRPVQLPKVRSVSPPFFLNFLGLREFIKFGFGFYLCLFKKIDYIIGIFLKPHGFFAHILGKIFNKPVIQVFISSTEMENIARHRKWLGGVVMNARHIGVRGTRSKHWLSQLMAPQDQIEKSFIHHNLFVHPNRPRIKTEEDKEFDIIFVAHYAAEKRLDIFFRVLSRLKKRYPRLKAILVGRYKKRDQARISRWIHEFGIQENVEFTGHVDDVFPYLYRSKMYMLTSDMEGLPMAPIEAMSIGLPCVVPDVGDLSDLVKDGENALVVKPLDVEGFIKSALRLLEDKALYSLISTKAYETIQKHEKEFSLEHIKDIWDEILT